MAVPKLKIFQEVVNQKRGNLTKVAETFGVDRRTVYQWIEKNPNFKGVIDDARLRLFHNCLATSEIVACGIPEKDDNGVMIGWKEKPDGNMLRYLMSTIGRKEGFSERQDINMNANVSMEGHIDIDQWIKDKSKK